MTSNCMIFQIFENAEMLFLGLSMASRMSRFLSAIGILANFASTSGSASAFCNHSSASVFPVLQAGGPFGKGGVRLRAREASAACDMTGGRGGLSMMK